MLYYLEPFPVEKECLGPRSDGLGAIIGVTTNWPPLPSYKVGNGLHSISGWFKVGLGWLVNAYFSHPYSQGGGG